MMSPPVYSNLLSRPTDILEQDYFHGTPFNLQVKAAAKNGVNFNLSAKQPVADSPLETQIESKVLDSYNGVTLTQGWSSSNNLKTKLEVANLAPGLKSEVVASMNPYTFISGTPDKRSVDWNVNYIQPSFTARGMFNFISGPTCFIGDATFGRNNMYAGAQVNYNIATGAIAGYSLALSYIAPDHTVGVHVDNNQVTTLAFSQILNERLKVASKAVLNPAVDIHRVIFEFGTQYQLNRLTDAYVKAKVNDTGAMAVSYQRRLIPGVTLGLGTSFNALNMDEPVHKMGLSLSFDA